MNRAQRSKMVALAVMMLAIVSSGCADDSSATGPIRLTSGTWQSSDDSAHVAYQAQTNCVPGERWFVDFGAKLTAYWTLPHAFLLGLISGETHVRVSVSGDGSLMSIAVVDSVGHVSLHAASRTALKNMETAQHLPTCAGVDSLILDLRFEYGAVADNRVRR